MALGRQIVTLTRKNLLIFRRRYISSFFRALLLPVAIFIALGYIKYLFGAPGSWGTGTPTAIRSFEDALTHHDGRDLFPFVNNGFVGGEIDDLIMNISTTVRAAGLKTITIGSEGGLANVCKGNLNGASRCWAGVNFISSPKEPFSSGHWQYTLYADGSLGSTVYVNSVDNDPEIYMLPLQRHIDNLILASLGKSPLPTVLEYPVTEQSEEYRKTSNAEGYAFYVINFLAAAFFVGTLGVQYHIVGFVAAERETGMSQLLDASMPNKKRWQPQLARLLSYHAGFDALYLFGWALSGLILGILAFPATNAGLIVGYHLLFGLSFTSFSLFVGIFFRKARYSSLYASILSIVLAIVMQLGLGVKASTGAVAAMSALFPPVAYVFHTIALARFQQNNLGLELANLVPPAEDWASWTVPPVFLWGIAILQIFLFMALAVVFEKLVHGTGTSVKMIEDVDSRISVRITGMSKVYYPSLFKRMFRKKAAGVNAVKDLSIDIGKGINMLLGANGSGKTTTMKAVAGLHNVSSGTVEVFNSGGIGLCPQANVLFDDLTVLEHIHIFNQLKSRGAISSKADEAELIMECDLATVDSKALAKNLSGGQQRKLQLACAFIGKPGLVCADEPNSGLDPVARDVISQILLLKRETCTLLITTHYLQDVALADDVILLSSGHLKAQGSVVELQDRYGGDYRVAFPTTFISRQDQEHLTKQLEFEQSIYRFDNTTSMSKFLDGIDPATSYNIEGPSMERVFLNLADATEHAALPTMPEYSKASATEPTPLSSDKIEPDSTPLTLIASQGHTSWTKQVWVLFRKRLVILRSSYTPYLLALIIPTIVVALCLFQLRPEVGGCGTPANYDGFEGFKFNISAVSATVVYGPTSTLPERDLLSLIEYGTFYPSDTLTEFQNDVDQTRLLLFPGGIFLGQNGSSPLMAWSAGSDGMADAVLTQNLLTRFISNTSISTLYANFPAPSAANAGIKIQVILYIGLALSVWPAIAFSVGPTNDRLSKVRALHYSNGVRSSALWAANFIFDGIIFGALVSVVLTGVFISKSASYYGIKLQLAFVFWLYAMASVALCYCFSLFATSGLAAFAFAAGVPAACFVVYFVSYVSILTYSEAILIDNHIKILHFVLSIFSPVPSMEKALFLAFNLYSSACDGLSKSANPAGMLRYGGPILYLVLQTISMMLFVVWWDSGGRPFWHSLRRPKSTQQLADPEADTVHLRGVTEHGDALRVSHVTKKFGRNTAVDDISFGINSGETLALLGPNGAGKSTTISLIRGDIRPSRIGQAGDIFINDLSLTRDRNAARAALGVCPQFDALEAMTVINHLRFYARIKGINKKDVEHNVNEVMRAVGLTEYGKRKALTLSGGNKRKLSLGIALIGNPSVLLLDEVSSGLDISAKRHIWDVILNRIGKDRAVLITTHDMTEAATLADNIGILAKRMLTTGTLEELRDQEGAALYVHLVHRDAPHSSEAEMSRLKQWVVSNIAGAQVEEKSYYGQLRFSVHDNMQLLPTGPAQTQTSWDQYSQDFQGALAQVAATPANTIGSLFKLVEANKDYLGISNYSITPTTLDQVFLNVVNRNRINVAHEEAGTHVRWWQKAKKVPVPKVDSRPQVVGDEVEGVEMVNIGKGQVR